MNPDSEARSVLGWRAKLQSWSKVMVHLAFFDKFTVPSPPPPPPPPPPPHTMLGQWAQGVGPWSNIVWRRGPSLGKRAAFIIEQGAIMKTKHIFKVYHILLTRIVGKSGPFNMSPGGAATKQHTWSWNAVCRRIPWPLWSTFAVRKTTGSSTVPPPERKTR